MRRRWTHRRLRWRGSARSSLDLIDGAELPVLGVVLLAVGLLLVSVAAVVVIIPALLFLADLVIIGVVVLGGVLGRLLRGRPWTVVAHRQGDDHEHSFTAHGWRESAELVHAVADQLRATGQPTGGERSPLPD